MEFGELSCHTCCVVIFSSLNFCFLIIWLPNILFEIKKKTHDLKETTQKTKKMVLFAEKCFSCQIYTSMRNILLSFPKMYIMYILGMPNAYLADQKKGGVICKKSYIYLKNIRLIKLPGSVCNAASCNKEHHYNFCFKATFLNL